MIPDWLNLNAPGYDQLSQEEKDAIMHFSLLWSLFETQVLDTSASAGSIEDKITSWYESDRLNGEGFEEFINYFTHRYIENGEPNYRFDHLHLRNNDKPDLVKSVLLGEQNSIKDILTVMLIIVLRYRYNFFILSRFGVFQQYLPIRDIR